MFNTKIDLKFALEIEQFKLKHSLLVTGKKLSFGIQLDSNYSLIRQK